MISAARRAPGWTHTDTFDKTYYGPNGLRRQLGPSCKQCNTPIPVEDPTECPGPNCYNYDARGGYCGGYHPNPNKGWKGVDVTTLQLSQDMMPYEDWVSITNASNVTSKFDEISVQALMQIGERMERIDIVQNWRAFIATTQQIVKQAAAQGKADAEAYYNTLKAAVKPLCVACIKRTTQKALKDAGMDIDE
jgi:hypothetical protein